MLNNKNTSKKDKKYCKFFKFKKKNQVPRYHLY